MFRKTLRTLRPPLIAALLAGATTAPAGAESLADAMVAAYRHSALLEQNRAVLRAADEDAATALAQLRPVVQWIAEHSFQKINGLAIGRSTGIGLQAQITLYDWGRNAIAIDAAKETVLATRAALVGVEQDVLLGAVQAYLDVRSATEQVDLQANSVRVIGQEQQAASDRFEVGEITQTDVSQADAALAAARASLAAARGNLEVAREAYRAATGRAPGQLAPTPPTPALTASLEAA
uniref:TolC family protein n=1 Tax=Paracoccus pantotrophus TaxID=82367 RepID=UPI0035B06931